MGNHRSSLRRLRIQGVPSLLSDNIFASFNKVQTFEEFHMAFLDFSSKFNSILPGRHFYVPLEEVTECYERLKDPNKDIEEKKDLIIELIQEHAIIDQTNDAVLMAGLIAPPVAIIFKRLLPDVIFVPTCTLLAIFAAKMMQHNLSNHIHGK